MSGPKGPLKDNKKWSRYVRNYEDGSWSETYEQRLDGNGFHIFLVHNLSWMSETKYEIKAGIHDPDEDWANVEHAKSLIEKHFREMGVDIVNDEDGWSLTLCFDELLSTYETLVQLKDFLDSLPVFK